MKSMKTLVILILVLILTILFISCSNHSTNKAEKTTSITQPIAESTTQPPKEVWQWQKDSPENQNIDSDELFSLHSIYNTFPLLSAVIIKNDKIIDEYYKDGNDETSQFVLNSASKSVTGALIGIAIDKGFIESVDVPISQYFPQINNLNNNYWKEITVYHLLTHTSGISSTDSNLWYEWRNSNNWLDYIFNLPVESEPGRNFSYSTGNTHLLSAILEQATGMSMYDFGKAYLFEPMGMGSVTIDKDPQGISDGGNGIHMNVYDMAKFGRLFLNKGNWEGRQLISEKWVEDSTSVQYDRSSGTADYGYQWWVRSFGDADYDAFFAQGHAGQYIFVVPEIDLIVVFTSNYEGSTSIYWQLVERIVNLCDK